MRHQHDGEAALATQLEQEVDHSPAWLPVEGPGRLVAEEDLRAIGQRARYRDPLAFAARELLDREVGAMRETDAIEEAGRRARVARPRRTLRPIIGSSTFSTAESVGIRLWSWKTKPISRRRAGGRDRRPGLLISVPPIASLPAVGRSSAPRRFKSVVLPEPDGPTTATRIAPFDLEAHAVERAHAAVFERAHQVAGLNRE